ncbi:hypothetical protein HHK36_005776 [Tetracentron sinense]|uniref:Uncharacterized protein n=1 Tax=Tetracentron sinense TaxID=13715 RepID=A0A835DRC6_TETSI|nr:hypothetical protein HHK36_005776 [Tetracentron sinense]
MKKERSPEPLKKERIPEPRSPEPLDFFIWTAEVRRNKLSPDLDTSCWCVGSMMLSAVACLKGEQEVRRPWWAPSCLSVVFVKVAKRNRQSRVVSLKLEP